MAGYGAAPDSPLPKGRERKFALIEKDNPEWLDLWEQGFGIEGSEE
jgi:hypothetical protein